MYTYVFYSVYTLHISIYVHSTYKHVYIPRIHVYIYVYICTFHMYMYVHCTNTYMCIPHLHVYNLHIHIFTFHQHICTFHVYTYIRIFRIRIYDMFSHTHVLMITNKTNRFANCSPNSQKMMTPNTLNQFTPTSASKLPYSRFIVSTLLSLSVCCSVLRCVAVYCSPDSS